MLKLKNFSEAYTPFPSSLEYQVILKIGADLS